jgi:hypothetical protein
MPFRIVIGLESRAARHGRVTSSLLWKSLPYPYFGGVHFDFRGVSGLETATLRRGRAFARELLSQSRRFRRCRRLVRGLIAEELDF